MISKLSRNIFASVTSLSMALIPVLSQACTSFLLKGNDNGYVYGRTMEFGIPLKSALIVIPRNFQNEGVGVNGKSGTGLGWKARYAATGANAFGMPILIDGMNEVGLVGGLLNAPTTAVYQNTPAAQSANSIASYQMLTYALTNYATIEEVKAGFTKIQVNNSVLPVYNGPVQVRMTLHDKSGKSIVIEYLKSKLVITDNPVGVMTNDPEFSWHLNNIGNYANLTKMERNPLVINGASFSPPSSGSGMKGLPGDFLSPSRFIRALFLVDAAPSDLSTDKQVNNAWHILGNFDIPPGAVTLPANNPYGGGAGGYEITEWSTVADTKNLVYYIKTYDNQSIQAFYLKGADFNAKQIRTIPLNTVQTYQVLN